MHINMEDIFRGELGWVSGRFLAGSKSGYVKEYPTGQPIFNANIICLRTNGKVWHGDVDLVRDNDKLMQLLEKIGPFCVLREHDGRFENEYITYKQAKKVAVKVFE